ncbi:MAG: hypothetical protein ACT4QA_07040 [Panacagrimonas sp.]
MQLIKRRTASIVAPVLAALATITPAMVYAQTSYASLTSAVDWDDVSTGLVAIGAAIVTVYVVWRGVKMLTSAVRGA